MKHPPRTILYGIVRKHQQRVHHLCFSLILQPSKTNLLASRIHVEMLVKPVPLGNRLRDVHAAV